MDDINNEDVSNICTALDDYDRALRAQRYPDPINKMIHNLSTMLTFGGLLVPVDGVFSTTISFLTLYNLFPDVTFSESLIFSSIVALIHGLIHNIECEHNLGVIKITRRGKATDSNLMPVDCLFEEIKKFSFGLNLDGLSMFIMSYIFLWRVLEIDPISALIVPSVTYISHWLVHKEACQEYANSQELQSILNKKKAEMGHDECQEFHRQEQIKQEMRDAEATAIRNLRETGQSQTFKAPFREGGPVGSHTINPDGSAEFSVVSGN
jgi:hypothetical protein